LTGLVEACFNLWVKRVGEEEGEATAAAGGITRERGLEEADCKHKQGMRAIRSVYVKLTEGLDAILRGGIGRWILVGRIFALGGEGRSFLINCSEKKWFKFV
jgi:hypothetical protein